MNASIFNSVSYVDISSVCLQRTRRQNITQPPTRAELQESPYATYTQEQLNMRRKCEILKYAGSSTKTNQLTKQQMFSKLATKRSNYSSELLQGVLDGTSICSPVHDYVPTSSTSCDIPGPGITLFLDPTVPLYNYKLQTTAPSSLPVPEGDPFSTFIGTDIEISTIYPTELFILYIGPKISDTITEFQFSLPFSVTSLTVATIQQVFLYVYYNSTLITSNDVNGTFSGGIRPLIQTTPVVTTTVSLIGNRTYTGMLYVKQLQVYSTPGFVLDVKVLFITQPKIGVKVICNPTGGGGLNITNGE